LEVCLKQLLVWHKLREFYLWQISIGKAGFGGNINIMQIQHHLLAHLGNNLSITQMEVYNILKYSLYLIHTPTSFAEHLYLNHHQTHLIHLSLHQKSVVNLIHRFILMNKCILLKGLLFLLTLLAQDVS
jgi:hypothetical protein